eukprot:8728-Heterococcus_DN1.PRE.2
MQRSGIRVVSDVVKQAGHTSHTAASVLLTAHCENTMHMTQLLLAQVYDRQLPDVTSSCWKCRLRTVREYTNPSIASC